MHPPLNKALQPHLTLLPLLLQPLQVGVELPHGGLHTVVDGPSAFLCFGALIVDLGLNQPNHFQNPCVPAFFGLLALEDFLLLGVVLCDEGLLPLELLALGLVLEVLKLFEEVVGLELVLVHISLLCCAVEG